MSRQRTRRRFLTAAAAVLGGAGLASTTNADDHRSFVLEQDGDCLPVVPLSGERPVEEFYQWGLPERSYSSEGTRALQESETSLLFLYRGPGGVSLVLVHDALDDGTPGGKVSFEISGVPTDATWVVKDDLYDASTNVDTWEIGGTVLEANESTITDEYNQTDGGANGTDVEENATDDGGPDNETGSEGIKTADSKDGDDNDTADDTRTDEIDWWWTTGRTDGGALRGLGVEDLELRIEPAFNDEAELADKPNEGEVTSWELLSGDRAEPDRTELDLEAPLTLRTGSCDDGGSAASGATPTATETAEEQTEDSENDTETGDNAENGTEEPTEDSG